MLSHAVYMYAVLYSCTVQWLQYMLCTCTTTCTTTTMWTYIAHVSTQLSGAQGALLPLLIRAHKFIPWNHLSSLGSIQLNCCHYSAYRAGANQPTLPSQVPIYPLGGEKQLWLSVLLKDTSVTAGIRTHILLLTPELESGKLDRSATTCVVYDFPIIKFSIYLSKRWSLINWYHVINHKGNWLGTFYAK